MPPNTLPLHTFADTSHTLPSEVPGSRAVAGDVTLSHPSSPVSSFSSLMAASSTLSPSSTRPEEGVERVELCGWVILLIFHRFCIFQSFILIFLSFFKSFFSLFSHLSLDNFLPCHYFHSCSSSFLSLWYVSSSDLCISFPFPFSNLSDFSPSILSLSPSFLPSVLIISFIHLYLTFLIFFPFYQFFAFPFPINL